MINRNKLQSLQWTAECLRKTKPYHLFEYLIAIILMLFISCIVIVALYKWVKMSSVCW